MGFAGVCCSEILRSIINVPHKNSIFLDPSFFDIIDQIFDFWDENFQSSAQTKLF